MASPADGDPPPEVVLLQPARLWSRTDVLSQISSVPAAAGVYAWYFDVELAGIPAAQ